MAQWIGRWPLSRKILGLALLNLIGVALLLAAFAEWQFGLSLESLLLGPSRDKLVAIGNAIGRELDAAAYDARAELLANYSQRYDVTIYLVNPDGELMAGPELQLPEELRTRMRNRPRPPRKGPPPPGRRGGFGPPGGPPPGGRPPANAAFLTVTRHPLAYWVAIRIPTNGPEGERGIPAMLLLRAASIFNSKLFFDWRSLLWLGAALAAVAIVSWWPFVHSVTRSVRRMDAATARIANGQFDVHITRDRSDELGHLGEQINRLAERLAGFVTHQKRFVGDISHELCAPIARIQFALGILEQRVDEAQRDHVAVLRDEIQEMSALVNELLIFSKAGMQPGETPLARVEIDGLVKRAVSHQLPGTGTVQVAVDGLAVMAYEPYLLRAISNLLRNALRYAGDAGPITVAARREGRQVLVTVADSGPGVPEDALEEVFTPFYRPESARGRDTGGAGLGLAIVKSCVEACRGTVACRNRRPGLEVTICLAAADA